MNEITIDVVKWISITMNICGAITLPLVVYIFKLKEKGVVQRIDKEEERSKNFYEKINEVKKEVDDIKQNYLSRFSDVKQHISNEINTLDKSVAVIIEKLNHNNYQSI